MHRQHVLVKSLQIIETFNSVSVIATDKAALLTQNQLTVTHLSWDTQGVYEVEPSTLAHRERNGVPNAPDRVQIQAFQDLLLGAALCNNAEIQMGDGTPETESELHVIGDDTDTALYKLCANRCSINIVDMRRANPRLKVSPLNPLNPFMISAHQLQSDDRTVLVIMKGAPDAVIQRCSTYMTNGNEILPFNDERKELLSNRQQGLSKTIRTDMKVIIL